MSVITEVMVANGSEARPFTWGHLSLERLIPNLTAGLIVGILVIISSVSYTALIFAGELAPHLSVGIGVALIGAIVLSAVMALTSSFPAVSAQPQDNPAVILALIAASLTGQLQARGLPSAILPTVIALLGVASLATGIFFLLLGLFGLGKFVRFIPYPVIGGFLTGTGWLITKGAMEGHGRRLAAP